MLCTSFKMSSLNLDHPLEIDEILPVIGPFGRFQFVLELLFCIMELPNGLLIMMPYFSHHNPPWRCVTNSTICHLNGTYSSGQNDYKARCSMPRSHWEFTRPKQHSVVTQVRFLIGIWRQMHSLFIRSLDPGLAGSFLNFRILLSPKVSYEFLIFHKTLLETLNASWSIILRFQITW